MKHCRICFATGVRMMVLGESEEKTFLESLIKSDGINEVDEYFVICYECKALLTKSYNFFKRALKAHRAFLLLQDQKSETMKVNKDMLKTIKTEFGGSMLSYHKVEIDIFFEDESEDPMCEVEIDTQSLTKWKHEAEDPICEDAIPLDGKETLRSNLNLNETEKEIGGNEVIDDNWNLDYPNYMNNDYRDDANKSYHKFEEGFGSNEVVNDPSNQDYSNVISDTKKRRNNGTNVPKRMRKNKRTRKKRITEIIVIMNTSSEEAEEEEQKRRRKRFTEINEENILTNKRKPKLNKNYSKLELKAIYDNMNINGGKGKKQKKEEQDYMPNNDESSSESEASYDSYDDSGKRLKRPPREYPRQCDHCEAEIEARKNHYKHYLIHHTHEMYPYRRGLPYVCQYCGVRKAHPSLIEKHEKIHGEKNVPCDKCDMKFHHNTALIRHRRMVHEENTLFCDCCNKGFKEKRDIILHIRTHTGEKPFKCHLCRAAFATRGNLTLHLRKHERLDADGKPVTWKSRPRKKKDLKKKIKEKRTKKKALAQDTDSEDIDLATLKSRPRKKKDLKKKKRAKKKAQAQDTEEE